MNLFKNLYKINSITNCWEYTGNSFVGGYGWLRCYKRRWLAHRLSYIINIGEIPKEKELLHICDNRKCINPKHLKVGTRKENIRDMIEKGRMNKERVKSYYEYKGKKQGLKSWAKEYNINRDTLNNRLNRLKWDIKKALETPIRIYERSKNA